MESTYTFRARWCQRGLIWNRLSRWLHILLKLNANNICTVLTVCLPKIPIITPMNAYGKPEIKYDWQHTSKYTGFIWCSACGYPVVDIVSLWSEQSKEDWQTLCSPVQHSAMLRDEDVPWDLQGMHCEGSPSQPICGHPEHISNAQPEIYIAITPKCLSQGPVSLY